MDDSMTEGRWLLFAYSVPKEPSTIRVNLWRRLRDIGVLYVAQSACVLPETPEGVKGLETCRNAATDAGGTARLVPFVVENEEAQASLVRDFQALRAAEYAEFLERAEALLAELAREGEGGKFIFAELEENEDELEKLEKWLVRMGRRDVLGAPARDAAVVALDQCRRSLAAFRQQTIAREVEFDLPSHSAPDEHSAND
jgi:hypothetical protein